MKISTVQILKVLYILSWIIFVGLCIVAGGFIVNAFFAIKNPAVVKYLWQQVDLSDLFKYDHGYFFVINLVMSIVAVAKAWLFYLIISILHSNKLNLLQLFSKEVRRFIFKISYLALLIGLFSKGGANYTAWLIEQGVKMPDIQHMQLGGADVWLFMSVILFVIAQIFKRGIELQQESELTI
ncbi:DUF2975 domain-containing protein [Parafilimonas terrae]|uniref:DUF2975 domain-containing protein n=1 Tax=Parafilimonas terrae TaxID=1465490 RepID=A0A1I5YRR5_9BACT|nr:DUF2975 domain-containing protein [Parafilimonas terrae]SFQ46567.1 Protein of unknown function [Parafilimonas terrae]